MASDGVDSIFTLLMHRMETSSSQQNVASDGVDSIFTLLMDRMETMQKGAPHVQLHILRLPTLSWLEALKVKSGYLFYVGRQLFRHNPTEDQYIPAMHNSWGFVWRAKLVTKI